MYTIDKQNGYMLAEYMQEVYDRGSVLERTPNKREQNDLMNSGWLKSMYGMPTSHLLSNPPW
mgnify:CR=1 FL=1